MIAADSSVVVAAFASWHELHEEALDVLDAGAALPAHAALESYAVLTRLPPPLRVAPEPVVEFLAARFPGAWLTLDAAAAAALPAELSGAAISGGATYDGLIAATAREHGATLVTLDARAARAYEALAAPYELVVRGKASQPG